MENNIHKFLNSGTKQQIIIKKVFVILITIYSLYLIGYGIGKLFAHIGLYIM